jgi:hypothetical protein
VGKIRPELWPNDWILRHDNSPAHKVLSAEQFPVKNWVTEKEQPPCFPDLATNDFRLLTEIKFTLNK